MVYYKPKVGFVKSVYEENADLKADLAVAKAENEGLLQELDDYIRIRKINVKRLGEFEKEVAELRGLLKEVGEYLPDGDENGVELMAKIVAASGEGDTDGGT